MRLWPRSLHYRLLLIVLLGLLLANGLSLTLVLAERLSSARQSGRGCFHQRGDSGSTAGKRAGAVAPAS